MDKHTRRNIPSFLRTNTNKKITVESRAPKKNYIIDVGLRRVILKRDIEESRILENLVFLELRRRKTPPTDIRYWRENNNEVDFVITDAEQPITTIQVTETLGPDTQKKRNKTTNKNSGKTQNRKPPNNNQTQRTNNKNKKKKNNGNTILEIRTKPPKYVEL